jgi:hypothetical protein
LILKEKYDFLNHLIGKHLLDHNPNYAVTVLDHRMIQYPLNQLLLSDKNNKKKNLQKINRKYFHTFFESLERLFFLFFALLGFGFS